jgi:alanyl-tRNA synthetase
LDFYKEKQSLINEAAKLLKINSDKGVRTKIMSNNDLIVSLNNTIKQLREENTNAMMSDLESKMEDINGHKLLVVSLNSLTHDQEDSLAHKLIDKNPDLVLFFAVNNGEKKDLVVARGNGLSSLKAGNLMKEASKILDGRGGGKPDVAFGGCASLEKLSEVRNYLKGLL